MVSIGKWWWDQIYFIEQKQNIATNNTNATNPDKYGQEVKRKMYYHFVVFSSLTVKHSKILRKADETSEGHTKGPIAAGVVSPQEEEY